VINAIAIYLFIYIPITKIRCSLHEKEKGGHRFGLRTMKYQGSTMINICDIELIGLKLEQGELTVNLSKEYFQQEIIEDSQAERLLRFCSIANLVGERIVGMAVDLKYAKEVSIKRISGVPFLMIFKFQHKY
jgi:uncharacterized protein